MNEAIATAVIVSGILVGVVANYWVWSWILAVRRRTRVRRLARPGESPPEHESNKSVDECGGMRQQDL